MKIHLRTQTHHTHTQTKLKRSLPEGIPPPQGTAAGREYAGSRPWRLHVKKETHIGQIGQIGYKDGLM